MLGGNGDFLAEARPKRRTYYLSPNELPTEMVHASRCAIPWPGPSGDDRRPGRDILSGEAHRRQDRGGGDDPLYPVGGGRCGSECLEQQGCRGPPPGRGRPGWQEPAAPALATG